MKAVFLDRDGTLIEDRGFLSSPAQVVFFDNTIRALLKLKEHYQFFIVTNQACVSSGEVTKAEVDKVNDFVVASLSAHDIAIAEVYTCPHSKKDHCQCRKPKPYFLYQARDKYNLNLESSFTIGDHLSDVELGENVGAKGIYVLTGHGCKHKSEINNNILVVNDIEEAADYILSDRLGTGSF